MNEIFSRNVPGLTTKLQNTTIGIAGCGGLGSNIAVLLVRSGIGKLILADFDRVEASNLNRQSFYQTDIGRPKAEALACQLRKINPAVELAVHNCRVTPEEIAPLFGEAAMLIEAFDRAESKEWLIGTWCRLFPHKPVICGSGLAGYGRFAELKIRRAGNIYLCGDETSEMSMGLSAPRVMLVAAMQANLAVELAAKLP